MAKKRAAKKKAVKKKAVKKSPAVKQTARSPAPRPRGAKPRQSTPPMPELPPELDAIRSVQDDSQRADAIAEQAPHFTPETARQAVSLARDIEGSDPRAQALAALANRLQGDEQRKVFGEALALVRGHAWPLTDLVEALPEGPLREEALHAGLAAARSPDSPTGEKVPALLRFAHQVPASRQRKLFADALKELRNEPDEEIRRGVLFEHALAWPEDMQPDLLKLAEPFGAEARDQLREQLKGSQGTTPPTHEEPNEPEEPDDPDGVAVRIHSDNPAVIDQLDRMHFAAIVGDTMQAVWDGSRTQTRRRDGGNPGEAFIIHIHGPWGAGKSSALNFLGQRLSSGDVRSSPNNGRRQWWLVVWFNAWRHQRAGPPWWALVNAVYKQCRWQLLKRGSPYVVPLFLRQCYWYFRTSFAPILLALAVVLFVIALAIPSTGTGASGDKGPVWETATKNGEALLKSFAAVLALFGVLLGGFRGLLFGSSGAAKTFMEISSDPMRPIVKHFQKLIASVGGPVAIFIDDLDRCEGSYVLELLRGIQTMFHESHVTYVVAADRDWLRASYEKEYENFKDNIGEPGRPLGYLFLDKLFQVSVPLPRLSPNKRDQFLASLVDSQGSDDTAKMAAEERKALAEAEEELKGVYVHNELLNTIDQADNPLKQRARRVVVARRLVAPEAQKHTEHVLQRYKHLLEANPRSLKRLVNRYGFEKAVSLLSDRDVALGPLVRWTALRMRWPALADHLEKHPIHVDWIGKKEPDGELDEELQGLFHDAAVAEVVNAQSPHAADALRSDSLRLILGLEEPQPTPPPAP